MERLLRFVSLNKWQRSLAANFPNDPDDVDADVVTDLKTNKNRLSVFLIDDDQIDIKRIIAAYSLESAPRELDYALINLQALNESGLRIDNTAKVNMRDVKVNQWHYDIVELSGKSLITLAHLIKRVISNGDFRSVTEDQVIDSIVVSVSEGHMNKDKVIKSQKNRCESSSKTLVEKLENIVPKVNK